ncbi:hypothetical protein HHK36_008367 [Tetracentron sinense]|uniref:E3 ubiquitin protein ligase n=1 Tax=Tetracentron sinense TaxID=13715 RepID=A0A834ZQ17_TETSI|nr:hypothetical protein HHK36_008367 [Tetracentron sinense]
MIWSKMPLDVGNNAKNTSKSWHMCAKIVSLLLEAASHSDASIPQNAARKRQEILVQVGLEYRFMPPVAKLIEIVKGGILGQVKMVAIREHQFPFLVKTGSATESCSANDSPNYMEDNVQTSYTRTKNILRNIVAAINDLWYLKDGLSIALLETLPEDGPSRQKTSNGLEIQVKNLRVALGDLHLKHKSMASVMQSHRDTNAKNKAELKRLTGELESTVVELEKNNSELATRKAQRDAAQGAFFPVLNLGNKNVTSDRARDKQKDLQDMESTLKELLDQTECRMLEVKSLHEERIGILKQLSYLQNTLKDVKLICSSKAYVLVEKDNFGWREKEVTVKVDLADIFRRASAVADSRISELEKEIQKRIDERIMIETKLEEASREPGRKEIIAEFKALVSSFPKDMGIMQSQLSKYKEAALEVHSLRAEVQSLSNVLGRKANELETLSGRSADQVSEIEKLQAVVQDLKESDQELKLILEMYRRESTDSR